MNLLRSFGLLCVCLGLVVAASAQQQTVTIHTNGTACSVDIPRVKISHDASKHERVHWMSGDGQKYEVRFKTTSPCYTLPQGGSGEPTIGVPAHGASNQCFAPANIPEDDYEYGIYRYANNAWVRCVDPVVVVTDGGFHGSKDKKSKKSKSTKKE